MTKCGGCIAASQSYKAISALILKACHTLVALLGDTMPVGFEKNRDTKLFVVTGDDGAGAQPNDERHGGGDFHRPGPPQTAATQGRLSQPFLMGPGQSRGRR